MEKLSSLNILVLLENEDNLAIVSEYLIQAGANVFICRNIQEAHTTVDSWIIDIIILDDLFHFQIAQEHSVAWKEIRRIVIGEGYVVPLKHEDKCTFLSKPISAQILVRSICSLFWKSEDIKVYEEHFNQQMEVKFTFITGEKNWNVSDFELNETSLIGNISNLDNFVRLGALLVDIPEAKAQSLKYRFVVDLQPSDSGKTILILSDEDLNRWKKVLEELKSRQKTIDQFLLRASGK